MLVTMKFKCTRKCYIGLFHISYWNTLSVSHVLFDYYVYYSEILDKTHKSYWNALSVPHVLFDYCVYYSEIHDKAHKSYWNTMSVPMVLIGLLHLLYRNS